MPRRPDTEVDVEDRRNDAREGVAGGANGDVAAEADGGDVARDVDLPYGVAPPGYRLPGGTRPGRVRLQVADLERSLDFYERVLGLGVLERREGVAVLGPRGAAGAARTPVGGAREAAAAPAATAANASAGEGAAEGSSPAGVAALVELRERPGVAPVPRRGRLGLYHFAILLPERAALGRFVAHLAALGERAGASDHRVSEAIYLQDADGLGIEVYADRPRPSWRYEGGQIVMATDPLDVDDLVASARGEPWEGMPPGTTIGHVHLHVGDLPRAEAFYHRALGLDKVVWSYPGALFLSAGGYHHHLGVNTWAAGAAPAGDDDARLLEWELVLPDAEDVRRALDAAAAAGYDVERGAAEAGPAAGAGAAAAARAGGVLRDPWGVALRLRD